MNNTKIIAEPFFGKFPKNPMLLEEDFVRLDKSIIWEFNQLFWKHYALWEKTYGEHFETSLPSGISESHKPEFIEKSAERFLQVVRGIDRKDKVYVFEQGPGSGIYAKGFLDFVKERDKEVYERTRYLLTDTSEEILKTCAKILERHTSHIKLYMLEAFRQTQQKFLGKIVFARHSNMWSQFPYRLLNNRKSGTAEVYTRAICDEKFEEKIQQIKQRGLEYVLVKYPHLWKEFYRTIKLQSHTVPFSTVDLRQNNYVQNMHDFSNKNIMLSQCVFDNLDFLNRLVDWDHQGYIEIVDLVVREGLQETGPLKYDGAVACKVDGNCISGWGKERDRQVSFTKIRKFNTMITIKKQPQPTFEYFPMDDLKKKLQVLPKNTHIAITCTSKKGIEYTIDTAVQLKKIGLNAYPHIIARYIEDEKHLKHINSKLIAENIYEIFIAAGDTKVIKGKFDSTLSLLQAFNKIGLPYRKLAFAGYPEGHPYISKEKLSDALGQKQEFVEKMNIDGRIITQLCFDADTLINWAISIKKQGITLPIHVGFAGKCNIIQLMQFAAKCGVGDSIRFLQAKKSLVGKIVTKLALQYNPDTIMNEITKHPLFASTNIQGFHYYTFNNV